MLISLMKLAALNVRRNGRRSLFALMTLSSGVCCFMLAGGFITWIFDDMREMTIHSQLGHVQITRPGYFSHGIADPYSYLLPPDDLTASVEAAHSAIKFVAPRLAFSGLVSAGDTTVSFVGEGVAPLRESSISRAFSIISGVNLDSAPRDSVVLGEGLAISLGVEPGGRIVLLATAADGSFNAVELEVAGLFSTITKAYDDTVLRVPIDVARSLMKVDGATTWVVLLDDTRSVDSVVDALNATLSPNEYEIVGWFELADFYNKTVELFTRQIDVVRLLIALIIVLSISNTMFMTVIERTREIGTALAIGVRRSGILVLFIWEGALLGFAGALAGVGIGYGLATLISYIGIPMPPAPGMAHGYIAQVLISPSLVKDAFLLAFMTTVIASLLPAWKASRMNIVDALRHQG